MWIWSDPVQTAPLKQLGGTNLNGLLITWWLKWSNIISLFSLQISPFSIPLCTFFHPPVLEFFLYSLSLFFDATIRNVYLDGCVLEELIWPSIGLSAASPYAEDMKTGRKVWDQVEYASMHMVTSRIQQWPKASSNRLLYVNLHSEFYFGSFAQLISSALTSSSTHS